ncbi:MAG: insulinase family protein [Woeseiaceae bacterium]|nr:insulinase family protein [Woeseiaceae bacterium]
MFLLAGLVLGSAPAQAALDLAAAERFELDNGMTVLLLVDRNFPVASVQMLYRVGARNEVTGQTGLAHFLEHMAFRATESFPGTEVVSRIYAVGGEWHGYTWTDQTTYYATVPREHLGLLLEIEADRMAKLVIDPGMIEAERGAVLAELHMYENDPGTLLLDALMYTSFLAHPYRNNTIGWESDLEALTHADVAGFYEAHYHPANAVLAVVGDIDSSRVRARIEDLFGGLGRRPATPLPHTIEPVQRGERRIAISGTAPGRRFLIGYRAPAAVHPDYAAFLVLQELLAGGSGVSFLQNDWGTAVKESRLLAGAAEGLTTWFPPSAEDYLFVIGGRPGDDRAEQAVENGIEQVIADLRESAPAASRVSAAIAAVRDELVYDIQTTEDAAHQLAFFEGLGALDVLLTLPQRVATVTPADVSRVARTWLAPERRTIAWYRPGVAVTAEAPVTAPPPAPSAGSPDLEPVAGAALRRLANGLPVIVFSSDLAPSADLAVFVPGVALGDSEFTADDPDPGFLAWRGRARPAALGDLAARAAAALARARHDRGAGAPASLDPATRLREEFGIIMDPPAVAAGAAARPALVVVAGDVEAEAAFAAVDTAFGRFEPAATVVDARATRPTGTREIRLGVPVAQAQLGYITAAPAPRDPDYLPWRLLLYVFAHDYEGRLGTAAISERGLAYYIDARYESTGAAGWTTLAIGVDPGKREALAALLAAELERLVSDPPTRAEIDEAKRHLLGRAVSAAQANEELVTKYARHWLRHGELPATETLASELENVSRADVRALVPRFAGGLTISILP